MKITVIGAGYVGLSLSVLLSCKYSVIVYDIDNEKIKLLKKNISPIEDKYINDYENHSP